MTTRFLPRSKGPVLTMATMVLCSAGAVTYSHYAQLRDKAVMRSGVERDKERLRALKDKRKLEKAEKTQS